MNHSVFFKKGVLSRTALPLFFALCLAAGMFSGCNMGNGLNSPLAPENVIAAPTFKQIDVSWTSSSGADGYVVYYNTVDSESGAQTLDVTNTETTITGLADSTTYHIRVKARNTKGTSASSVAVQAKTSDPLPDAFYNSAWFNNDVGDGYIIADYETETNHPPVTERWELTYSDWLGTTGGEGYYEDFDMKSYGFIGFIKYFSAQTPSSGESDAGVIILEYHSEEYAPLGAWEGSEPPPGRGRFGAVYYHTLIANTSAVMGNASNSISPYNAEETTLQKAVDKFGPSDSINTYYSTAYNTTYDYEDEGI
jgi:hypothetical protein